MRLIGFRKPLTSILAAIGAIVLCVGTGLSTFYFYENATATSEAADVADDIRQNQTFGTNDDSTTSTTTYYDVYFMPQMVDLASDSAAWEVGSGLSFEADEVTTISVDGVSKPNYSRLPSDKYLYYKPVSLTDTSYDFDTSHQGLNSTLNYDSDLGKWVPAYGYMDPTTADDWGEVTSLGTLKNDAVTSYSNSAAVWQEDIEAEVLPLTIRKFSNVSTICQEMIESVGVPATCLYDCMDTMYQLEFCAWSVTHVKTSYSVLSSTTHYPFEVAGSFPTDFEHAYFGTTLDLYADDAIYINGTPSLFFYPVYSTGKGYYEKNDGVSDTTIEDGLKVQLTTNVTFDEKTETYTITKEDSWSDDYRHSIYFCYDKKYTEAIVDVNTDAEGYEAYQGVSLSGVECYRLSDVRIDNDESEEGLNNYHSGVALAKGSICLAADPSYSGGWTGSWVDITYTDEEGTQSRVMVNDEVGTFNIYIFSLANDSSSTYQSFTSLQTQLILKAISDPNVPPYIEPYKSYDCDVIGSSSSWTYGSRDYFVVFEKVYEPRLIAGPTKTFDYESSASEEMALIRQAASGVEKNSLSYDGVTFDFDNDYVTYDYTSPNTKYTYRFTDYFFSFQLARYDKYDSYSVDTRDDDLTATDLGYSKPTNTYRYSDNTTSTEEYKSDSLFVSLMDEYETIYGTTDTAYESYLESFKQDFNRLGIYVDGDFKSLASLEKATTLGGVTVDSNYEDYLIYAVTTMQNLIRPLVSGVYNLYVHVNFTNYQPTSLDVWGHRRHNFFVNVNDSPDSTTKASGSNYVDITNYSYRYSTYYYLLSYIMPGDTYYYYTTKETDGTTTTTRSEITFLDILLSYHNEGKCLRDRVTGKYITYQDYYAYSKGATTSTANLFQITGNHVLEAVAEPTWASNTTSSSAEALL